MVSTQERRHEWFSIGEVGPEEKKGLCSFVKKTHTKQFFPKEVKSFFSNGDLILLLLA